jgi:hypothetical protein
VPGTSRGAVDAALVGSTDDGHDLGDPRAGRQGRPELRQQGGNAAGLPEVDLGHADPALGLVRGSRATTRKLPLRPCHPHYRGQLIGRARQVKERGGERLVRSFGEGRDGRGPDFDVFGKIERDAREHSRCRPAGHEPDRLGEVAASVPRLVP